MKEAYPQLFNEDVKAILRKYHIELITLVEPDFPDEKLRAERKIIGLGDMGLGLILRSIILDIYTLFELEELRKFFDIENEFHKFTKFYIEKLKESVVVEQFRDIIGAIAYSGTRTDKFYKERDSLEFERTITYYERDDSTIEGGNIELSYNKKVRYTPFVAFLAPQMLIGLAYIRPSGKDVRKIRWGCILGWES